MNRPTKWTSEAARKRAFRRRLAAERAARQPDASTPGRTDAKPDGHPDTRTDAGRPPDAKTGIQHSTRREASRAPASEADIDAGLPVASQPLFEAVCQRLASGEPWPEIAGALGVTWPEVSRCGGLTGNRERWARAQTMHRVAVQVWIAGKAQRCAFDAVRTVKTTKTDGEGATETTERTETGSDAAMARVALEATDPERFGKLASAAQVNVGAGAGGQFAIQVVLDPNNPAHAALAAELERRRIAGAPSPALAAEYARRRNAGTLPAGGVSVSQPAATPHDATQ